MQLTDVLDAFEPLSAEEARDVEQIRQLALSCDPWPRALPLHATASAVVVHPPTRRVLLRWHARQQAWLQVGGHADPGETDPYLVARREAEEETGLSDLVPWPDPSEPTLVQVAIVPVSPGKREPAHQHADFRYTLATAEPDAATPESPSARLLWLALDEALASVAEDNLRVCLRRIAGMLS
ncbi:MAG: NUDIX domain-containing protein [Chloroflexi bacterium]|nr:NUDIX domain-containing protein [Chloroflexota bacterium]